jgi:hypothetical protein
VALHRVCSISNPGSAAHRCCRLQGILSQFFFFFVSLIFLDRSITSTHTLPLFQHATSIATAPLPRCLSVGNFSCPFPFFSFFANFRHAEVYYRYCHASPPSQHSGRPCMMRKMATKAIEIGNAFRKAAGHPQIEQRSSLEGHRTGPTFSILPFIGTPPTFAEVKNSGIHGGIAAFTKGGGPVQIVGISVSFLFT